MNGRSAYFLIGIAFIAIIGLIGLRFWRSRHAETTPLGRPDHESLKNEIHPALEGNGGLSPSEELKSAQNEFASAELPMGLYERLLNRHRTSRSHESKLAWSKTSGFEWDLSQGYLLARLLARCHPQEVEDAAFKTVNNPLSTPEDIIFAAKVLAVLASTGRRASETALLRLVDSAKDESVIAIALDCVMSYDREGRNRAIYWTKCAEGILGAFEFGPYWVDQQTKQTLMLINERDDTPSSPDFYSREALKRMAILESPERISKVDQLVAYAWSQEERPSDVQWQERWALRVAQFSPTADTIKLLRGRLERAESEAAGGLLGPVGPIQSGYQLATRDQYFDEALLTYFALGGTLNETETNRLHHYGYLGDPKERLEALLALDQQALR